MRAESESVRFVLVRPGSGGNIGAAARALKNMGFASLWLVQPRGFDAREARRMAHGAEDVLENVRCADSLQEALASCRWSVGTTRRAGRRRTVLWTPRTLRSALHQEPRRRPVALVFGPEEDGLSGSELKLCQDVLRIPTSKAQPSLNLAQAILILAYELADLESVPRSPSPEATAEALEPMYAHLEEMLLASGFLRSETAPTRMLAFRRLLGRARLRPHEVRLVRGVCRQVLWALRRSRSRLDSV